MLTPPLPGRTERDATSWSKRKLKEVLEGLVVEGEAGRCEIGDLKHVEGEASCNSRKGKLIFFYEWNLRLSWKGTGGKGDARGGGAGTGTVGSVLVPAAIGSHPSAEEPVPSGLGKRECLGELQ